jgi:hypothetical protein
MVASCFSDGLLLVSFQDPERAGTVWLATLLKKKNSFFSRVLASKKRLNPWAPVTQE